MSKDFQGIAHDVMTGVGLIRQSSPEAMKGVAALATGPRPRASSTGGPRS